MLSSNKSNVFVGVVVRTRKNKQQATGTNVNSTFSLSIHFHYVFICEYSLIDSSRAYCTLINTFLQLYSSNSIADERRGQSMFECGTKESRPIRKRGNTATPSICTWMSEALLDRINNSFCNLLCVRCAITLSSFRCS